jgi:hypothetical protein
VLGLDLTGICLGPVGDINTIANNSTLGLASPEYGLRFIMSLRSYASDISFRLSHFVGAHTAVSYIVTTYDII